MPRVAESELAEVAQLASLADETPPLLITRGAPTTFSIANDRTSEASSRRRILVCDDRLSPRT